VYIRDKKTLEKAEELFNLINFEPKKIDELKGILDKCTEKSQNFCNDTIEELKIKNIKITNLINKHIDVAHLNYKKERKELLEEQKEIISDLEAFTMINFNFSKFTPLFNLLISNPYEIYKKADLQEKEFIVNFIFSQLKFDGKKLQYTLKPTFNEFLQLSSTK